MKRNREQDRVRVPVSELQPLADAPPSAAEVANAAATPDADDESLGGGSSNESLRNTVAAVSRGSTRHYLNLSNGVEAIEGLVHQCGVPPDVLRFCRIQSSHCEQRDFVSVLDSLDPDLLMHLALGYRVRIYDFGSGQSAGRATASAGLMRGHPCQRTDKLGRGASSRRCLCLQPSGGVSNGSVMPCPACGSYRTHRRERSFTATMRRRCLLAPSVDYPRSTADALRSLSIAQCSSITSLTSLSPLLPAPYVAGDQIKYYRTFVSTDVPRLEGIFTPTRLDGQRGELAQRLWRRFTSLHTPMVARVVAKTSTNRPRCLLGWQ